LAQFRPSGVVSTKCMVANLSTKKPHKKDEKKVSEEKDNEAEILLKFYNAMEDAKW
jgi:hypothetical protein